MIKVSGNITEFAESTLESLYGSPEVSQYSQYIVSHNKIIISHLHTFNAQNFLWSFIW